MVILRFNISKYFYLAQRALNVRWIKIWNSTKYAKEAGGQFERQSANKMINESGRVVVGSAGISNKIVQLADDAFKD